MKRRKLVVTPTTGFTFVDEVLGRHGGEVRPRQRDPVLLSGDRKKRSSEALGDYYDSRKLNRLNSG